MSVKIELFFVRHGESCANVLKKQNPASPARFVYRDPELTQRGIDRSRFMYGPLNGFIAKKWGENPIFTIAASALIRTQMTAYYQLASHLNQPINIFPHICEHGLTEDNIPFPKETQRKILNSVDPSILLSLDNGQDFRSVQTTRTKSDFDLFFHWLQRNLAQFPEAEPQVYRFVIFTHGLFLQSAFPLSMGYSLSHTKLKKGKSIMNNGIFYTEFTLYDTEYPEHEYFNNEELYRKPYTCPDKCRKTLCKKQKGGTNKRRTRKH